MYTNLLIPVDLSSSNAAVINRARELGDPEHTEDLRENADAKIKEWAQKLGENGFDVVAEVCYGKQGQEIVAQARESNTDLIIMRSHVVDPDESREQLGTVSHQVALFAPCSVLLVRE